MTHFLKQIGFFDNQSNGTNSSVSHSTDNVVNSEKNSNGTFSYFLGTSVLGSYAIYFGIGGFLHVIIIKIQYVSVLYEVCSIGSNFL